MNNVTILPSLLLVDDDNDFLKTLANSMTKRGFSVSTATSSEQAFEYAQQNPPEYAVVDLNMGGQSGLVLIPQLVSLNTNITIVMLTGYASIVTAIEAIKLGATHYLAKPVDADQIIAAFNMKAGNAEIEPPSHPLSVNRLEWEHIQRVLSENNGNISATARSLNMHRRTLQRKLNKNPKKS